MFLSRDGLQGGRNSPGDARRQYAPRVDYPLLPWWTSVYHHGPLRRSQERHVDFERLNSHSLPG